MWSTAPKHCSPGENGEISGKKEETVKMCQMWPCEVKSHQLCPYLHLYLHNMAQREFVYFL